MYSPALVIKIFETVGKMHCSLDLAIIFQNKTIEILKENTFWLNKLFKGYYFDKYLDVLK